MEGTSDAYLGSDILLNSSYDTKPKLAERCGGEGTINKYIYI
jgi:hypothetical protein